MRIRFYANVANERVVRSLPDLTSRAAAAGLEVVRDGAADVVVALGGDGTILRAVREAAGTPLLGFNFGSLGYLANVEESAFDRAFALLREGRWTVRERTMLAVAKDGARGGESGALGERALPETGAAGLPPQRVALNDVVIVREMTGHAAVLDLSVNGREAARYTADGLVVATPTGSTAYSLSAGGPVLMPDTACFVVTPMNPHALGVRPLVLTDDARLTVASRRRVPGANERVGVYADGEAAFFLEPDESASVVRAARPASFVELEGFDPYAVMARKLGWKGSVRA